MISLRSRKIFALAGATLQIGLVVLAVIVGCTPANANEKAEVLDGLRRYFGKPIDAELNLYNISKPLVLQATFQDDRLVKLAIKPKAIFNDRHPNWKETNSFPTISYRQYRDYLKKFGDIKPIGSLLLTPQISVVTNSTAWRGEYFENAYIDTGMVGRQNRVRVLTVNYFSRLRGKVLSKSERMLGVYEITLEADGVDWDHRYYVKKDAFDSLVVDQIHSFEAAFVN